jgi:hypothetical protein
VPTMTVSMPSMIACRTAAVAGGTAHPASTLITARSAQAPKDTGAVQAA